MKRRESMKDLAALENRRIFIQGIDPTEHADPLFGVGSATSAGPTLPAGSIHPCPETLEKDCGGYTRNQPIVGFGSAYLSGTGGKKSYGNYLIAPMVGAMTLSSEERAAFAVPGSEIARCYEYRVELENGIRAKITPAHDSAIYEFTYPAGKEASLLIDVARKLDLEESLLDGCVCVDPSAKTVYGGGCYTGNWSKLDWNMFFALQFDGDFTEIGTFCGEDFQKMEGTEPVTMSIDAPQRLGAYVKFGSSGKTVRVKIAISFVSAQRALEHLEVQIPDFDYSAVCAAARDCWRQTLGVIELQTDDAALLRRFYTAMYHMNIQPRDRTADHGTWDDFHTVWDSWKTVFPMYTLLYPNKMSAIVESFLQRAQTNEELGNGIVIADEYATGQEFLAGQGGNDIDNVIVDAYLKGIALKNYDWQDAYKVLLRSAMQMRTPEYVEKGYATANAQTVSGLPYSWRCKPAAATMGFAFNDRAIATMAKELGTAQEQALFERRSRNWQNVWNMENISEGFAGFPQNPNDDGTFEEGFDAHGGYNKHFYEATAWDASYINYNDVDGLIEIMGGPEEFTRRLVWACEHSVNYFNDDHGAEGYLNFTNEPSFHIPWMFCHESIKRPDLAAKVIDGIIERFSQKDDYPGDEDNGGMSSYYVFLMCGFFPYSTTEKYYLHGTRVEKITFRLGNGKDFVVTGENVGQGNIYVQSATWQGKPLNDCSLTHSQILQGGQLHFVMGDQPSDWARK